MHNINNQAVYTTPKYYTRCDMPEYSTTKQGYGATATETASLQRARYCTACRDYLPIEEFNTNESSEVTSLCKRHDDKTHKKTRWCRACGDFVCLSRFQKKKVVFLCKKHMYDLCVKKSIEKRKNDPVIALLLSQYNLCQMDCKIFKQTSMQLKKSDIRALLSHISQDEKSLYRLLPLDPARIIGMDNVVVVKCDDRKQMMMEFKKNNTSAYTTMAEKALQEAQM